jgi:hypothetical protein
MRRPVVCVITVLTLVAGILIGYFLDPAPLSEASAARPKLLESKPVSVPKAWGDLVGVSTFNVFTMLIFRDSKGTLRRVQWNTNGSLGRTVHVIERKY